MFFVCSLFCQRFLDNPPADLRQVCMRAYSGSGCVFSPFGGLEDPGGGKRGNKIFVTIGVNGEFLHFGGFWAISQQRVVQTKFYMCRDNVFWRATSPSGVHRPEWRVCVSCTDALDYLYYCIIVWFYVLCRFHVLIITRHSLVRAKSEVFVFLYVFLPAIRS